MSNKSKAEYDMQYAKENLKRIPLNVQKEKYEQIKAAADATGESVNGYIKKAIDSYPMLQNSFIITFTLDRDISFDNDIFAKLENELLANSEYMTGFIREGSSKKEYKFLSPFAPTMDITPTVF